MVHVNYKPQYLVFAWRKRYLHAQYQPIRCGKVTEPATDATFEPRGQPVLEAIPGPAGTQGAGMVQIAWKPCGSVEKRGSP